MAFVINAMNVNDGFQKCYDLFSQPRCVESADTRNGVVLRLREPVVVEYANPLERVLFNLNRDANPFFHLFESIWMLAGRNDVEFVQQFNTNIRSYSDDRQTFKGAYGDRWRRHFKTDQIRAALKELHERPETRRCVIGMWDPSSDLEDASWSKDVPCNTQVYFKIRGPSLMMTVCNRSNDMLWGLFGANAVHFSFLHEHMARALGLMVGVYTHFSDDVHLYTDVVARYPNLKEGHLNWYSNSSLHANGTLPPNPAADRLEGVLNYDNETRLECDRFCDSPSQSGYCESDLIKRIAQPMFDAWSLHKARMYPDALAACERIVAEDWSMACQNWISKRERLYEADGPKYEGASK